MFSLLVHSLFVLPSIPEAAFLKRFVERFAGRDVRFPWALPSCAGGCLHMPGSKGGRDGVESASAKGMLLYVKLE